MTFILGCYIDNETTNRAIEACGGQMAERSYIKVEKGWKAENRPYAVNFPTAYDLL